jgi:hypothetical protein
MSDTTAALVVDAYVAELRQDAGWLTARPLQVVLVDHDDHDEDHERPENNFPRRRPTPRIEHEGTLVA